VAPGICNLFVIFWSQYFRNLRGELKTLTYEQEGQGTAQDLWTKTQDKRRHPESQGNDLFYLLVYFPFCYWQCSFSFEVPNQGTWLVSSLWVHVLTSFDNIVCFSVWNKMLFLTVSRHVPHLPSFLVTNWCLLLCEMIFYTGAFWNLAPHYYHIVFDYLSFKHSCTVSWICIKLMWIRIPGSIFMRIRIPDPDLGIAWLFFLLLTCTGSELTQYLNLKALQNFYELRIWSNFKYLLKKSAHFLPV